MTKTKVKGNRFLQCLTIFFLIIYGFLILYFGKHKVDGMLYDNEVILFLLFSMSNVTLVFSLSNKEKQVVINRIKVFLIVSFLIILVLPMLILDEISIEFSIYGFLCCVFSVLIYIVFSKLSYKYFDKDIEIIGSVGIMFLTDGTYSFLDLIFSLIYTISIVCYWFVIASPFIT